MNNEFKYFNSNTLLNESIRSYSYRYIVGDLIRMKLNFINNKDPINGCNNNEYQIQDSKNLIENVSTDFCLWYTK